MEVSYGKHAAKALLAYRRRLKRRGLVRLEVHVCKDDTALVRGVVKALADPEREGEARALLRERFGAARQRTSRHYWPPPHLGTSFSAVILIWAGRLTVNYLLDTNIISEIRKGKDCDPKSRLATTRSMTRTPMSACWCSAKSAKALNGRAQQS